MPNFTYKLRSDKDTHFTGSLATNAIELEDIVLPGALKGIKGNARNRLRSISILSDQQLSWEVMLFTKDTADDTDADVDTMVGFWTFDAVNGVQIAGAGLFRYYVDGLDVSYVDEDNTGELHIGVINRSVTSKNAGATGEVTVELWFEIEGA